MDVLQEKYCSMLRNTSARDPVKAAASKADGCGRQMGQPDKRDRSHCFAPLLFQLGAKAGLLHL